MIFKLFPQQNIIRILQIVPTAYIYIYTYEAHTYDGVFFSKNQTCFISPCPTIASPHHNSRPDQHEPPTRGSLSVGGGTPSKDTLWPRHSLEPKTRTCAVVSLMGKNSIAAATTGTRAAGQSNYCQLVCVGGRPIVRTEQSPVLAISLRVRFGTLTGMCYKSVAFGTGHIKINTSYDR